ncbi:MAG: PEP-CTERM sorting domain-containing protein [Aquabacterium sp.]
MRKRLQALALATAAFALPAGAAEIVPLSYSFDQPTSCGSYCYHDETGRQLIDGAYGVEGWAVNLGNGNAYEWVGWVYRPVVHIDFDLGAAHAIGSISIGTTQDAVNDVVLPSIDISYWNGSSFVLLQSLNVPESSANDRPVFSLLPHGFLTLSGLATTAQQWRVTARFSADGPWTFIDEVDFYGAPIPEPSTYALMALGLAAVGGLARRRRG